MGTEETGTLRERSGALFATSGRDGGPTNARRFGARGPSGRVWRPEPVDCSGKTLTRADVAETIRTLVVDAGFELVATDVESATWQRATLDQLDAWAASGGDQ